MFWRGQGTWPSELGLAFSITLCYARFQSLSPPSESTEVNRPHRAPAPDVGRVDRDGHRGVRGGVQRPAPDSQALSVAQPTRKKSSPAQAAGHSLVGTAAYQRTLTANAAPYRPLKSQEALRRRAFETPFRAFRRPPRSGGPCAKARMTRAFRLPRPASSRFEAGVFAGKQGQQH